MGSAEDSSCVLSLFEAMQSMQCNAMQCNAMQCNAMQCNAMQCNHIKGINIDKFIHTNADTQRDIAGLAN